MKKSMPELIKEKRLEMGLTQEQLALLLGKEKSTVAKYEAGVVLFKNTSSIKKLSSVLKIPIEEFWKLA
jgi:transcriptional regulator with XRE-family HTH domain